MDIVTHGLASLAVARGLFPRAGKIATISAVIVGVAADADWFSSYFGPSAFWTWHFTYLHSVTAAFTLSMFFPGILLVGLLWGGLGIEIRKGTEVPDASAMVKSLILRSYAPPLFLTFLPCLCAALLHVAMDVCQSDGVMALWPFSTKRFALDWLPAIDPWILGILIACIAVPELLRLVSSEIGAKEKKPRGQTGALIGVALLVIYMGARATLHSNVIAALDSRTFHGESARRARAFPETLSVVTWHGVVETESALDQLDVNAANLTALDPEASLRIFKPQASPQLDAARNTLLAKQFLAVAQIPKAVVEKTETGYIVTLRDLRYAASGDTSHEIAAEIDLDANNNVTAAEMIWAPRPPEINFAR